MEGKVKGYNRYILEFFRLNRIMNAIKMKYNVTQQLYANVNEK